MAKVNTHGLKIKGLKKVSGETENYGEYSSMYAEIFYDRATGEVWTVHQCSIGHNTWTEYHDENVIKIGDTSSHMTMQEIADCIYKEVAWQDMVAEALKSN